MLQHAFKEWAAICQALAQGRQALILRKGGIAEETGEFNVEHTQFWLYPTYTHQQHDGLKPEAADLLAQTEQTRPEPGKVRLSHWCEVTGIYQVRHDLMAQMLDHLHLWTEETVAKRFVYRTPGLFVLTVRVYEASRVHEIVETAASQGCKSWVALDEPLPTEGSRPVLTDERYDNLVRQVGMLLNPTALA